MAVTLGYKLCSEERSPAELVQTRSPPSEQASSSPRSRIISIRGWTHKEKHRSSGPSWALSRLAPQALDVATAVTCPIGRMHPRWWHRQLQRPRRCSTAGSSWAWVRGKTSTSTSSAAMAKRRATSRDALEAISIIRALFEGDLVSHDGRYFTVDRARLYSLPRELPAIYLAAAGKEAAAAAGEHGDGMFGTAPGPGAPADV